MRVVVLRPEQGPPWSREASVSRRDRVDMRGETRHIVSLWSFGGYHQSRCLRCDERRRLSAMKPARAQRVIRLS